MNNEEKGTSPKKNKNLSVYGKLQALKNLVNNELGKKICKTGGGALFSYYQLEDFMPFVIEKTKELQICINVKFRHESIVKENNVMLVILPIIYIRDLETNESEEIELMPFVPKDSMFMYNMQDYGAMLTYIRRYAYIHLLELPSTDAIDNGIANINVQKTGFVGDDDKKRFITTEQMNILTGLKTPEEIGKIIAHYKVNDLSGLPYNTAQVLIDGCKKK